MRKLTRRPSLALLFAALFAMAFLAACGGSDSTDPTTSASVTATKSASPAAVGSVASTLTATPTPVPRAATLGPTPLVTPKPEPTPIDPLGDERLYLSLGDSLAAGNGSSDKSHKSWVALTIQGLGDGYELLNLGHAGDDSDDLINRQLDQAVSEIQTRNNDGIPGNETAAITLEIGGNDLLNLYNSLVVSGLCPSVVEALQIPDCVNGLQAAFDHYKPNLETILDRLKAADPNVPIFLMTLYNPFSGGSVNLDQIGALALEGQDGTPFPKGLNDIIREVGTAKGAIIVDWYPIFIGKVNEYIAHDLIHPNDIGHALMAQAVLDAMAQQGLP
jgi:lysophospholipase L1-like esterase